jgi:hypothetical protein
VSLVLAVGSFALFVPLAWRIARQRTAAATDAGAGAESALNDTAKLVKELRSLADTFAKAGPWVAALIASLFFLTIAFAAATADRVSDAVPDTATTTAGNGSR